MRKQFAKFVEFSVDKMHWMSQQFEEWLRHSRKQVWLWWNLLSIPTIRKQFLSLRWRFDILLERLNLNIFRWLENFIKKRSVCNQSWGTCVRYCFPQLIVVYVFYTKIKISALLIKWCILLQNKIWRLLGHPLWTRKQGVVSLVSFGVSIWLGRPEVTTMVNWVENTKWIKRWTDEKNLKMCIHIRVDFVPCNHPCESASHFKFVIKQ